MINHHVNGCNASETEGGHGVAAFPAAAQTVPGDRDPSRLLAVVPRRGQVPPLRNDSSADPGQGIPYGEWRERADGAGHDVGQRRGRPEALPLV
ncbi:hypothetical protein F0Q45_11265 [Mycobacterium simiae]|uniref:Uncharacterized protein n=1 Tax=Mycobacterium simiae TaxID=1784 RepID=A0A5B1BST3_MYCSI|nr:hypothetical protein [Mycobacterium simiae]KAA1250139.1 hypothetical protein F0Q45_11265 [Mycobacterium simiae]